MLKNMRGQYKMGDYIKEAKKVEVWSSRDAKTLGVDVIGESAGLSEQRMNVLTIDKIDNLTFDGELVIPEAVTGKRKGQVYDDTIPGDKVSNNEELGNMFGKLATTLRNAANECREGLKEGQNPITSTDLAYFKNILTDAVSYLEAQEKKPIGSDIAEAGEGRLSIRKAEGENGIIGRKRMGKVEAILRKRGGELIAASSYQACIGKEMKAGKSMKEAAKICKGSTSDKEKKVDKEKKEGAKKTAAVTYGSPQDIERSETVGSIMDPSFYCESLFRQSRQLKGAITPQEVFDGIVAEDEDLSKKQIEEIKRIALDVYKVKLK